MFAARFGALRPPIHAQKYWIKQNNHLLYRLYKN